MSAVAWWQKRLHPAPPISHSPGSAASNFAGKGTIKAIAARTREKRYYEGTELVGSNIGFSKGLQTFEDISARRSRSKRSARSLTVSWCRSHGSRKSA